MEAAISQPQAQQQVAAALLIIQMVVVISVFVGAVASGYWSDHRRVFAPHTDRGIFSSGIMDFAFLLLWIFLSIIPILLTPFFKIQSSFRHMHKAYRFRQGCALYFQVYREAFLQDEKQSVCRFR